MSVVPLYNVMTMSLYYYSMLASDQCQWTAVRVQRPYISRIRDGAESNNIII